MNLPCSECGKSIPVSNIKYHTPDRLNVLKPLYDEEWMKAKEEDRERVSFTVQPQVY